MKQILLLAAIYSLVLQQSRKNARARIFPVTSAVEVRTASLATGLYAYFASLSKSGQNDFRFARNIADYREMDTD